MGQWLSLPMILAGVALMVWAYRRRARMPLRDAISMHVRSARASAPCRSTQNAGPRAGVFIRTAVRCAARYFICTEPLTVTDTVALPPSTAIGALIFALSIGAAAIAIMRGYGCTLRPPPTFTSRIV